jgi:general stress protein YciG
MAEKQDRPLTMREAGRLGGRANAKNHDREHFQEIGRKGGTSTRARHDPEFYKEIGRKSAVARLKKREQATEEASGG